MKVSALVWAQLLDLLMQGAYTVSGMAEETGLAYETVREYLAVLHRKQIVHICDWEQDPRGAWTRAVWMLGRGKDAQKPPKRTSWQRKKDQRARMLTLRVTAALAGAA